MKKIALLLALLLVAGAGPGFAFTGTIGGPIEDLATSENYFVKFPGLLLDGVYHYTYIPGDLLYSTYHDTFREGHYVTGLFTGLGTGTKKALGRILTGTTNILVSPIPGHTGTHDG